MMLLDTSGLFSLFNADDERHAEAVFLFKASMRALTQSYVLAEIVALLQARRLPRRASLAFAADLLENPDIEVVWVNETLHREAVYLLQSRQDKSYSLCDAVSFVLMRERGITGALTTDHHFEQEGFRRLLTPP